MSRLGKKIILFLFASFAMIASGANITGGGAQPAQDWLSYARFLYPFMISVGAILAVIILIIAGLQMMTASESMRSAAKEKIQNALLGLFLLVGVYLILNTINKDLLNLKIDTSGLQTNINNNQNTNTGANSNTQNYIVGQSLSNGTCIGPTTATCGSSLQTAGGGCVVGQIGGNVNSCTVTTQYQCMSDSNLCQAAAGGTPVPGINCKSGCTGGTFCCAVITSK